MQCLETLNSRYLDLINHSKKSKELIKVFNSGSKLKKQAKEVLSNPFSHSFHILFISNNFPMFIFNRILFVFDASEKLLSHQNYKNLNNKSIKSTYCTPLKLINIL